MHLNPQLLLRFCAYFKFKSVSYRIYKLIYVKKHLSNHFLVKIEPKQRNFGDVLVQSLECKKYFDTMN